MVSKIPLIFFSIILFISLITPSDITHVFTNTNPALEIFDTTQRIKEETKHWLDDFTPQEMIKIGPKRKFKSLNDFFTKVNNVSNTHIVVDDGTYYDERIYINAEDLVIEGTGSGVNLLCTESGENVMEISGDQIMIKNISMKHVSLDNSKNFGCTGHVIMFDNANNIIIENCDLNGCGLSGLHDNGGNSNILVRNCFIHNNSIGCFTNSHGEIWINSVQEHSVFSFENNRIVNNGPERHAEYDSTKINGNLSRKNPIKERHILENDSLLWKMVPNPIVAKYTGTEWGDYFHIYFEDLNGTEYDFGFGDNNFGKYMLYDTETYMDNPAFLNQTFNLYWEWKLCTFPCCNGEYNPTKGYQPSIIKLERI